MQELETYKFTQNGQTFDLRNLPENFVIEGDLDLSDRFLEELPKISHVIIKGNLDLSKNNLKSLKGCPQHVGKNFSCNYNDLTSLIGGPQTVGNDYDCSNNLLKTFQGVCEKIPGTFDFRCNPFLISLEFMPKDYEHLKCDDMFLQQINSISDKEDISLEQLCGLTIIGIILILLIVILKLLL